MQICNTTSVLGKVSTLSITNTTDPLLIFAAYDEIRQGAQEAIDAFHERQARNTVPARSKAYPNGRPAYQKITEDPDYIKVGGELKPFQLTGLNWLAYSWTQGDNGILADEVSLWSGRVWTSS